MPQNIARIAITAISEPIFATCSMSPTAMPLVDDGRGEIRNQNFKHDAQRRIHRRKQRVFLYCLISFAMRAPVICFFSPVFFSSAIRILLFCSFCFYAVFFYAVILSELRGRRDFKHAPEEMNKRRRILSEHGEHLRYFAHEMPLSLFAKPIARFRQGHHHAPPVFFIVSRSNKPLL
ncbi:MAG: hypothetical protein ACLUHE_15720 [Christensenellales bacterium]